MLPDLLWVRPPAQHGRQLVMHTVRAHGHWQRRGWSLLSPKWWLGLVVVVPGRGLVEGRGGGGKLACTIGAPDAV